MATFRTKKYANKQGKVDGRQNKVQVSGDVEAFEAITKGDKDALKELVASIRDAVK